MPEATTYQVSRYQIFIIELATRAISTKLIQATSPGIAYAYLYKTAGDLAYACAARDGYVRRISMGHNYSHIDVNRTPDAPKIVYTPEYICTLKRIDE